MAIATSAQPANLLRALAFAAEKHRSQKRKGIEESPYINHLIAVAHVLAVEAKVTDEATLVAAILHDTIEDTKTTQEELENQFGSDVAILVAEVTDDKSLPKEVRKQLQVEHAPSLSTTAKRLKLADKICNIRDVTMKPPSDWSTERRAQYLDWAEEVSSGCRGIDTVLDKLVGHVILEGRKHLELNKGE